MCAQVQGAGQYAFIYTILSELLRCKLLRRLKYPNRVSTSSSVVKKNKGLNIAASSISRQKIIEDPEVQKDPEKKSENNPLGSDTLAEQEIPSGRFRPERSESILKFIRSVSVLEQQGGLGELKIEVSGSRDHNQESLLATTGLNQDESASQSTVTLEPAQESSASTATEDPARGASGDA